MDRYLAYGIRTDADEQIRRGFRDAFARAGLSHQQFLDALGWYRDHGQHLGADPAKLAESFHEFASGKGWDAGQVVAATSAYELIAAEGPAAASAMPSPEDDVATIARADALLKSDPAAYWRDEALQEAALEARERQLAAPPPEPGIDHDAIERRVAQQTVDRFADMMRKDPAKLEKCLLACPVRPRHSPQLRKRCPTLRRPRRGTLREIRRMSAVGEASPG